METYDATEQAWQAQFDASNDCQLACVAAEKAAMDNGATDEDAKNFAILFALQKGCTFDQVLNLKSAYAIATHLGIKSGDHGRIGETLLDPLDA